MADNVTFQTTTLATPAGGTVVATDDAGAAGQVQIFKLAISADGSATLIGGDAANGLDVDVTRAPGQVADGGALPAVIHIVGGFDGTNAQALATDSSGLLQVDVATHPEVTLDAGTLAALETIGLDAATLAALETITVGTALPAGTNNIGDVDVASLPAVALDSGTLTALETITVGTALPAGTNNIGDVDVLTLPAIPAGDNNIGDVDVASLPALPAGSANIGDVDVASIAAGDNNIGNVDVVTLPALPAGANNIGDVDVLSLPALPAGTSNIGDVDVLTLPALVAGTAAIGKLAANSGVDIGDVDVTSLPALATGSNLVGKIQVSPQTTGGLDIFRSLDLDETEEEIKATAGQVFGWFIYNDGAAEAYVKFYNATAANVTVGTTTPVMTVPIPAGSGANVEFTNGIAFGTAITAAATTAVADADTAAPAANQVIANVFFK